MSKIWQRTDFWPAEQQAGDVLDEFARGVAAGRETVEAEVAGERALLLQLATSLEILQPPSTAAIASLIVVSVERLVRDIAGQVPVDGVILQDRANALAAMIAGEAEVMFAMHPDDASLLDTAMPVIADPALARGTVQARSPTSVHEDGIASALDRLRAEIARLGIMS